MVGMSRMYRYGVYTQGDVGEEYRHPGSGGLPDVMPAPGVLDRAFPHPLSNVELLPV